MLKIPASAVSVIAADTGNTLVATDAALQAHAQMLVNAIEGARTAGLPLNLTQPIYAGLVANGNLLIESRAELGRIVTQLTAIKNRSDQREVATGCPAGAPNSIFVTGELKPEAQD